MMNAVRVMLYVQDVEQSVHYWQGLGARQLETQELPEGYLSYTLEFLEGCQLGLFPKAFIEKYSPEVAGNVPSIMFYVEDFDDFAQRAQAQNITEMAGKRVGNFCDSDGTYFAFSEV